MTRQRQPGLIAYKDALIGDRLTWEGEAAHKTDERIARAAENGESIYLFYRDVHHTPFRYHGQVLVTLFVERRDEPSRFEFQLLHDMTVLDDLLVNSDALSTLAVTEREQVTKARVGQGQFRDRLISVWRGCAVTGVDRNDLVRASHIKPWRMSNNHERLDPNNGLLLLPQYDHLFDAGYITFDDDGRLLQSPVLAELSPSVLGFDRKRDCGGLQTSIASISTFTGGGCFCEVRERLVRMLVCVVSAPWGCRVRDSLFSLESVRGAFGHCTSGHAIRASSMLR